MNNAQIELKNLQEETLKEANKAYEIIIQAWRDGKLDVDILGIASLYVTIQEYKRGN